MRGTAYFALGLHSQQLFGRLACSACIRELTGCVFGCRYLSEIVGKPAGGLPSIYFFQGQFSRPYLPDRCR